MSGIVIHPADGGSAAVGEFIHEGFSAYGRQSGVELNFEEFCFTAETAEGRIVGALTGRAYYDEVHIGDLVVDEAFRGIGLGSRLVGAAAAAYREKGYRVATLSTFGFQAPEFYKKLGYRLEFVRESDDPRLNKYFFRKDL
jgi:ribosomal protein S18 acetylase RimI-like enzyme